MYIAYFDETGDDGYPKYSSELFVLTSVYLHYQTWKETFEKILNFRKQLQQTYGLPIKTELHTKKLLLNKNPFRQFNWDNTKRLEIIYAYAEFFSNLNLQVINVCIVKKKINQANQHFYNDILDRALTFNVQRIENTIKRTDPSLKFMLITDEGRVGKMRNTVRKIQKINFIPSQFQASPYRQDISLLIEDPLPKNSKESFYIQLADFISYFVYLHLLEKTKWHNRLSWVSKRDVDSIIGKLIPILNLSASRENKYGIVCYPK